MAYLSLCLQETLENPEIFMRIYGVYRDLKDEISITQWFDKCLLSLMNYVISLYIPCQKLKIECS